MISPFAGIRSNGYTALTAIIGLNKMKLASLQFCKYYMVLIEASYGRWRFIKPAYWGNMIGAAFFSAMKSVSQIKKSFLDGVNQGMNKPLVTSTKTSGAYHDALQSPPPQIRLNRHQRRKLKSLKKRNLPKNGNTAERRIRPPG